MITLQKIPKHKVKELIELSYKDDLLLMKKYHVFPDMTLEQCVDKTMEMINETSDVVDLSYYKVIYNKQPIGYVVAFENFLYSFGININFRKKDILIGWFRLIRNLFKDEFVTMLFANNNRAIGHLVQKQGMKIVDFNKDTNAVTLAYGKEVDEYLEKRKELNQNKTLELCP